MLSTCKSLKLEPSVEGHFRKVHRLHLRSECFFLLLFSFFINYALTCTDNFGGIILEFFIVALYMASHDDDNDNNISLSFTDYFFYFLTPSFLTSLSCFPLFISFSFLSFLPFQPSYCVIPCPHYKYVIAFHVIF